ncbi:unnamed protein product [Trypanosoma congolense IL3000]|uniref:WGS project CAEQ00000000 data, annotated contig 350 n=1 Tax=Trypanosoma congolense (strain IL3000) TaxID=1068625 RepID=F9WF49_TRYCI|nr:unnamed protein product [Trypanosoma congolense IL3000]
MRENTNSEDMARGCLRKAQELKDEGKYKEAIEAMQSLSDHKVQWSPVYESAIDLLAELCFKHTQGVMMDRFFNVFRWNRKKLSGTPYFGEGMRYTVGIVMKYLTELCERARVKAKEAEKKPSNEEVLLSALTDVSLAQRAKERYLSPAENITQAVSSEMLKFNVIGQSALMLPIYLETAAQLITHCQTYNLKWAIGRVGDCFVRFISRFLLAPIPTTMKLSEAYLHTMNKELKNDREKFYRDPTMPQQTVDVFRQLLETLTNMNNWNGVWITLQCFTKVLQEITQSCGPSRKSQIKAYAALASLFWKCSYPAFHAYCLGIAAYLTDDSKESIASKAVLATLCVSNFREKRSFARGSDSLLEKQARIAQLFGLRTAPELSFLQQRLQRMRIPQSASKDVLVLDELLRSEVFDEKVSRQAVEQLSQIVQRDGDLEMYQQPLRKVIIQRYLESMSTRVTKLDTTSLQAWESEPSKETYINEIEPFILNESRMAVEIDHKTDSITFNNATKAKVLQALNQVAEHVLVQPAASKRKLDIKPDRLRLVRERNRILHELQHHCEESAEARRKAAKEKEEAERKDAMMERIEHEAKRRDIARSAQELQGLAQYENYINRERRKLVLNRLRDKYKGFKASDTIAQKNPTDFVQEVTMLLAQHLRQSTQEKSRDVTRMNHFERACREIEIPRRKAIELEEAEKNRAERAAAWQNFLAQHRKEFDKRQRDNELLRKFLKEAALFEQQMPAKSKVSKRAEQEMLLEREKERLQGQ